MITTQQITKLHFHLGFNSLVKRRILLLPILFLCLIVGIGLLEDFPNLLVLLLSRPATIEQTYTPTQLSTSADVSAVINAVSKDRILTDLRRLTGAEQVCLDHGCFTITNRMTGSVGLQWAQDYVVEQLTGLGYSVQIQSWSRDGYHDENLIVRKQGIVSPQDEIYFVAHMDGVNVPAADDNGSGTVDLLEVARMVSRRDFEKTIVLLFSSGEEQGTQGVSYYLDHLTPEQLAAIKYVVNVDMVGYDNNQDGIMELFNGDQDQDFVQFLADIIASYHINLTPQIVSDCG
ncbi:MAG: hypothetical protein C3F13_12990 [Anaerolineales bacterium]|nr:MAG: hypothetical protein C3F13_12990 [Anaerolineales bacterium]